MSDSPVFYHKLDSYGIEVVFAPFHDPELAPMIPLEVDCPEGIRVEIKPFWCWTSVYWKTDGSKEKIATLRCAVNKHLFHYTHLVLCLYAPVHVRMTVASDFGNGSIPLSDEIQGTNSRQELFIPLGGHAVPGAILKSVELNLFSTEMREGQVNLIWFGLCNESACNVQHQSQLARVKEDWQYMLLPQKEWGQIRFAKGLLFSEHDLKTVRKKISLPGWQEHFQILSDHAQDCLARDPEKDIGNTISANNNRYSRERERGRIPYYWDALTLAFVGLVQEDHKYIEHALRYLCCMLDSPRWIETAECAIPTSTWNYRSFPAEMTTTSVVLLGDWLDFALPQHTRSLLKQAVWDRGVGPVISDLLHYPYMSQMNQGAVFSRAVILGALFLENYWGVGKIADEWHSYMTSVLHQYILPDGYCSEGPTYLCQTLQGVLAPIIAYARQRGRDWRKSVKKTIGPVVNFMETLSLSQPGRCVPVNDSRTTWFGGDGIPILARIDPSSSMNRILYACLVNGQVFRSSGTLTNSGGILGLIYGPDHVRSSESIRPSYKYLKKGKMLVCSRKQEGREIGFFTTGPTQVTGHGHPDKGQFVIDVDSTAIAVDPGMVRYSAIDAGVLQRSCLHNVITPILEDGSCPNQKNQAPGSKLTSKLSRDSLSVSLDLSCVWPDFFIDYKRIFLSSDPTHYRIIDKGKNRRPSRIAFHVNIPFFPKIQGREIFVNAGDFAFTICAEWCSNIRISDAYPGSASDQIYHITFESDQVAQFSFETTITIKL